MHWKTHWLLALCVLAACGQVAAPVAPQRDGLGREGSGLNEAPVARRGDHVDVLHGQRVADPYRWLEGDHAEADAWRRAHDQSARRALAALPGRAELETEVLAAARATRRLAPQPGGERFFYVRTAGAVNAATVVVREGDAERVAIDGQRLRARGQRLALRVWPSPDGRLLAYGVLPAGGRAMALRVLDVDANRDLPFVARGLVAGRSSVSWLEGGTGLAYVRYDERGADPKAPLRNPRVVARALETEAEVVLIRGDSDDQLLSHWTRTGDPGEVVVAQRDGHRSRVWLIRQALGLPVRHELAGWADGTFTYAGDLDARMVFATTVGAERGWIRTVRMRDQRAEWTTLVGETDAPIESWVGLGEMVAVIGARVLAVYRRDVGWVVRGFDATGKPAYQAQLPVGASMWTGLVPDRTRNAAFLSLSGFVDPGSAYRLDVETGELERWSASDVAYDLDDYVTEIAHYTGARGQRVPIFLTRRRDLRRDGARPVLLYGYGWGGWSAAPWFRPHVQALLDRGGIMALPVLRGGGEYGEAWHRAGVGRHRPNAIADYLAAARALADGPWTARGKIVAEGQSAGGSLAAMAVLSEPELFGAQLLPFPVLDMLRYERFSGAAAWKSEFGSADALEDFAVLHATSPVHQVPASVCAPPTLLLPGEVDDTTPPLHAFKFAAALRHAQACAHPVWLRIAWGTGHAYGTTPEQTAASYAAQLAFVFAMTRE